MIAGRYLAGRGLQIHRLSILSILALVGGGAVIAAEIPQPDDQVPVQEVGKKDTLAAKNAPAPFAVVELFTSESCPSCPAADKLLSDMGADARKKGQRILPLAFHVDYWQKGSAADPFSDNAFAMRQKAYAAAFDTDDIYTPQMIVNGRIGFVGNEKATADKQIKAALGRPAAATVKLALDGSGKSANTIRVNCDVRTASTTANLQIAVVERNLSSKHGKKLDNVVRSFKSVPLSTGTYQSVELRLPTDLVRKNASVVAYVQEGRSLAILGAASADMSAVTPTVQHVASADSDE